LYDVTRGIRIIVEDLNTHMPKTPSEIKRDDEPLVSPKIGTHRVIPSKAHAYNGKGNVLYKLHRYEEALAAFEQAILMDSTPVIAYNNRGLALEGWESQKKPSKLIKEHGNLNMGFSKQAYHLSKCVV